MPREAKLYASSSGSVVRGFLKFLALGKAQIATTIPACLLVSIWT